jgi:hypothetical protein
MKLIKVGCDKKFAVKGGIEDAPLFPDSVVIDVSARGGERQVDIEYNINRRS